MELEQLGLPVRAPRWRAWLGVSMAVVAGMIGLVTFVVLHRLGESDSRMICRARFADKVVSAQVDGQIATALLVDALTNRDQPGILFWKDENVAAARRLDGARAERLEYGADQKLPCPIANGDIGDGPHFTLPPLTTITLAPTTTTPGG